MKETEKKKKINDFYASPNIILVIKPRIMRSVGHVERKETRNMYPVPVREI